MAALVPSTPQHTFVTNEYTEDQADQTPSESPSTEQRGQRDRHRDRRRQHRHGNTPRDRQSAGADDQSTDDSASGETESSSTNRDERSGERRNDRHRRGNRRTGNTGGGRGNGGGRGGSRPSISVVIPLLNEEESLDELTNRLVPVLETESGGRYEILYIDDGSTDSSFEIIRKWNRRNGRIHGIRFRRNNGKSAALAVGFAQAKNDVVITMDADLQDDPLEIPNLIAALNEGYDLVSGWKKRRKDPLEKRLPSKFFNHVTSVVSGVSLHDFNCGLKAYRSEVIKTVQIYGEMHRYIPALAHWEGFTVTEIPVTHHARKFGHSKFGMSRYLKGFLDLLTVVFTTRFIKRPLHLFGALGALFTLIGLGIDIYLSVEWALSQTYLTQRPLMLMGVAFIIVGVQLISIGLIGEMIVKNNLSQAEYSIKEQV